MEPKTEYDVIVLGAGPAGYTAGIYLARFLFKTLILESLSDYTMGRTEIPSARSSISGPFRNVPGYPEGVPREELKWHGIQQAKNMGCDYQIDEAMRITREHAHYALHCRSRVYTGTSLFLAMGVKDSWPELPGLHNYVGRSLFWSVESNGFEAQGKPAAVMGTNDHSALEAVRLLDYCPQVYFLTHGEPLVCSDDMRHLLTQLSIPILKSRIKTIQGSEAGINGLILEDGSTIAIQTLYFSPEHRHPRSELARELGVHTDAVGFVHVNDRFETNLPNVYAIGDITSRGPEQVVTSYYHGMQAAWALHEEHFKHKLQKYFAVVAHR